MQEGRPFIFVSGDRQITLPVTPSSYTVTAGMNIEIINIHELGDAIVVGESKLDTIKIDCMLPAILYPFASDTNQLYYLANLERMRDLKEKVRFIVGNTHINKLGKIESVSQSENDGTGDIYVNIVFREYRELEAVEMQFTGDQKKPRSAPAEEQSRIEDYKIKRGDTISQLCKQKYGSSTPDMWDRLAKYNGIKNRDLIYTGNNMKFPHPLP